MLTKQQPLPDAECASHVLDKLEASIKLYKHWLERCQGLLAAAMEDD